MLKNNVLLNVKDLKVYYPMKKTTHYFLSRTIKVKAIDGVSFQLKQGETLGVVGESGCGKSTLARTIIGLNQSTSGEILFLDKIISRSNTKKKSDQCGQKQMIFQDPLASLNPRIPIGKSIAEPLLVKQPQLTGTEVTQQVISMMDKVGLLPNTINRYPHEFSGGQCQRIAIARALIVAPKLLICDEPVSALDVSIQAQIINLLQQLQDEMQLSLLFIAHDLAVVKHISDQIMVMYLGHIVEQGRCDLIYTQPKHPYTQSLLAAIPNIKQLKPFNTPTTSRIKEIPSPINPPSGCVFHTRCPIAKTECSKIRPSLQGDAKHQVACLQVNK